jgi:hypothetical protein
MIGAKSPSHFFARQQFRSADSGIPQGLPTPNFVAIIRLTHVAEPFNVIPEGVPLPSVQVVLVQNVLDIADGSI